LEARFFIRIFGIAEAASFHGKESNTARRSRNQKQMTHTSEGIATDDNIFARRTTNLRISSTEDAEYTETRRGKNPAKLKPVSLAGEAVLLWIKQFGEARVFLEERKILVIARVIAVFRA